MSRVFAVPIVQHELREQESYLQALDALDNLNKVVVAVLERISTRIASEAEQVASLAQRVETAQAQVDALKGHTRAATVFASPKYPAPTQLSPLLPLSGEALDRFRRARHIDYALDVPHAAADVRPSVALPELLLFGGVDTAPHVALSGANSERLNNNLVGLGRLPPRLQSVASLLLFNTDHTPYEQYTTLDNLLGHDRSHETRHTSAELFAAPRTVAEGDTLPAAAMLDFTYAPALEALPAMSLPSALPNLPGVADIQWLGANDDVLAPSGAKRGGDRAWSENPRPQPATDAAAKQPQSAAPTVAGKAGAPAAPASASAAGVSASASSASATAVATPPPPPPPSSAPVSAARAPPPPPPPPAAAAARPASAASSAVADGDDDDGGGDSGGGAAEGDGGRGDLLASIRAGRKLRKVADRKKAEEDSAPAKHGSGTTGSMMGDLMMALSRRRKGIASNAVAKQENLPPIGRVVPPPKQQQQQQIDRDDEEWSDH